MEPLKNLYLALAEIFDSEGREGVTQAAEALINASHKIKQPKYIRLSSLQYSSYIYNL